MRLTSLTATNASAGTVYSFSMGYAPNSDVLSANDSVNGNWTYGYDDFNRLSSSNKNGGAAVYSYVYDRFGNRLQQNGPNSMLLTFTGNNNRMDGYTYDAAGNVTYDLNNNYTYDAENRIIQVTGTLGTTTYTYDAMGQRVRKSVSGVTTDYVYDLEGHAIVEVNGSGGANRDEIFAGGKHIATYVNSTTYFSHADWLGTERVRSDMTGAGCESISSLPFGDSQSTAGSCGDPSTRHFTDKERDPESGLDYFGARYYNSPLGRFMSDDWSTIPEAVPYADLTDPQSLNLYGYVRNNPLTHTDADGHCCDSPYDSNTLVQAYKSDSTQFKADLLVGAAKAIINDASSLINYIGSRIPGMDSLAHMSGGGEIPQIPMSNEVQAVGGIATDVALTVSAVVDGVGAIRAGEGSTILSNAEKGAAFEKTVVDATRTTDANVAEQVTLKTESGVKTRMDVVSTKGSGEVRLQEAKSSATAPLTKSQKAAHPEIAKSGATVVGQGKPGYPGGTKIPPTKVEVVRP